jgi:hypothetical protein
MADVFGMVFQPRAEFGLASASTVEPAQGLTVTAKSDSGEFHTDTASDGTYQFMSLPPGRYTVSVQTPPKRLADESFPWNVGAGVPCRVDVQTYYDGTISGGIIGSNASVIGAVTAFNAEDKELTGQMSVAEVENGRFKFVRVAPGRYRLRFTPKINGALQFKDSYFYPGTKALSEASEVVVGEGEHVEGVRFTIP